MPSDNSRVSSAALIELKTDLTHLSESLHEIYDLMNADMSQVGEYWEDPKYAEFVSGYQPQIKKCEEISKRYGEWCKRVLDPTIEKVILIETADVGGEGGGPSSGGGAAAAADGGGGSSGSSSGGKFDGFNMGEKSMSNAEKADIYRKATDELEKRMRKPGSKPSDSGFDPRENKRPALSPEQMFQFLNGRQR